MDKSRTKPASMNMCVGMRTHAFAVSNAISFSCAFFANTIAAATESSTGSCLGARPAIETAFKRSHS